MNYMYHKALLAGVFLLSTTLLPAQIIIGSLASGEPELRLNDAELNTRLAFTLGGTTLQNAVLYSGSDVHGVYYYVRADGVQTGQNARTRVVVYFRNRAAILCSTPKPAASWNAFPKSRALSVT